METADIDKEFIYMEAPQGFKKYDSDGTQFVCELEKSLYGLKQAPRLFHLAFHERVESLGFVQLTAGSCVHHRVLKD